MTDGERKRLEEEFGSEEAAAEDYGNWAHEQAGKRERRERQTWLQNLYQRIRNFFQRLKEFFFPSFRTVYDKVSSGKIWERTARRDATEAGKTIFRDAADYAIRNFSGEKEVSVPAITDAIMASRPITKAMAQEFVRQARRAGVSEAGIRKAVEKFQQYNEIRKIGNFALLPKIEPSQVVIREGVLNTPAVTGIRRERLDKILYPAIREGKASAETGRLIEGGVERTAIPETARGLEPQVFLNLPITQPDLSRPRPANLSYPLMVTGNPHLTNFKRPDPSWDSVIRAVRVKPVLNGSPEVTRAVAKAINYAREIGAHVLITTYRAKHPWSLARFTNFVPTDPKHPEFGDWWIENPRPRGEDPRTWMDWTPWVPRKPDAMAALFRANGWDTAKNLYGPSSYNVLTIVNSRKKGLQGFKTREEAEAYLSDVCSSDLLKTRRRSSRSAGAPGGGRRAGNWMRPCWISSSPGPSSTATCSMRDARAAETASISPTRTPPAPPLLASPTSRSARWDALSASSGSATLERGGARGFRWRKTPSKRASASRTWETITPRRFRFSRAWRVRADQAS
jgi:hypothetical protein